MSNLYQDILDEINNYIIAYWQKPTLAEIAHRLHKSDMRISRAFKYLVDNGYIECYAKGHRAYRVVRNVYRIDDEQ